MFWGNVLRRAGSDYCVNDIFPGTFPDFRLRYLIKKNLVYVVIHARKIFNCNASLQMPLLKCFAIVAKEL